MKRWREQARQIRKELLSYHPGNITADNAFKHDEAPPMSERVVEDRQLPVLYDSQGRPIYRKIGF